MTQRIYHSPGTIIHDSVQRKASSPFVRAMSKSYFRDGEPVPVEPQSAADNEARIVQALIATERYVLVLDRYTNDVIEEVLVANGMRYPESGTVPLLDNHTRFSVQNQLGSARQFSVDGPLCYAQLYLTPGVQDAEDAYRKIKNRDLRDVSVGYHVTQAEWLRPGESKTVGGKLHRAGKYNLRIALEWHLQEVSLTPIGADDAAKIRARELNQQHGSTAVSHFAR